MQGTKKVHVRKVKELPFTCSIPTAKIRRIVGEILDKEKASSARANRTGKFITVSSKKH